MTTPQPATESPTDSEAALELRAILRELRGQRIALVVLAVTLLAIIVVGGLYLNGKARDATLDRKALCTFRDDLQARVDQSRDFLIEHPDGFAGIPAATIQKSIADQSRTIKTLRPLPCP